MVERFRRYLIFNLRIRTSPLHDEAEKSRSTIGSRNLTITLQRGS